MPRPRTHDDALRERLLVLTGQELSAHGPAALSLRTIAREAGTSTTAVYSLFGGKAALLGAVFDEAFRRFGSHLAAVTATGDPLEDLVRLAVAYRTSARADPHFYGMMFGAGAAGLAPTEESLARARATFAPLVELVRRAVDEGVLRPEDPLRVATALWSSVHGFVSLELAGLVPGVGDVDDAFVATARSLVRGWAPDTAS